MFLNIKIHKNIIFPDVFIGVRTDLSLSLSLRDGHKIKVFENRVLRRIFGSKREEVVGGWRRLHNEDLHQTSLGHQVKGEWYLRRM
jgi:hypothetical protein